MNDLSLIDARAKFARARELCSGMSEEIYALTDYFSAIAHDTLRPNDVMFTLFRIVRDLSSKQHSSAITPELPDFLVARNAEAWAQLPRILDVIDIIAEPDFAVATRTLCESTFHWNTPNRANSPGRPMRRNSSWHAPAIAHS